MNKISKLWLKFSDNWFGNKEGLHCYWCKHTEEDDLEGGIFCSYVDSEFNDGKEIKNWKGTYYAKQCPYFEIKDWYTDDKNFYKSFPKVKKR